MGGVWNKTLVEGYLAELKHLFSDIKKEETIKYEALARVLNILRVQRL